MALPEDPDKDTEEENTEKYEPFIPDDVTFDEEPKDLATDVDLSAYTHKLFTSTAAATSKVELTWDETDHERVTAMNRKFNKDELLQMDFNVYLASSSVDDDDDEDGVEMEKELPEVKQPEEASKEVEKEARKGKQSSGKQIEKYREMLKSIQEKDKKKEEDKGMEMEITWVPGGREGPSFPGHVYLPPLQLRPGLQEDQGHPEHPGREAAPARPGAHRPRPHR